MRSKRPVYAPLLLAACFAAAPLPAPAATLSSPRLLADLVPGVAPVPLGEPPRLLAAAGVRLLFTAQGDVWSSDGTPGGNERVLAPEPAGWYSAWQHAGAIELFVESQDPIVGPAVYRTDGTAAGTRLVVAWPSAQIVEWSARGAHRSWYAPCFPGDREYRCELWTVDGAAGTASRLVSDLVFDRNGGDRVQPTIDDRLLVLTRPTGSSLELWRSDGTASSTVRVVELPAATRDYWLGRRGSDLFFTLLTAAGWEVWKTDGTAAGTRPLRGLKSSQPYGFEYGFEGPGTGPLFLGAYADDDKAELWAITGGEKVRRLGSFAAVQQPLRIADTAGRERYLFAAAPPAVPAPEGKRLRLWTTDGTPGGTGELRGIRGGPVIVARTLGMAGGRFWFAGGDGGSDVEPWTSDGTAAGTRRVADVCPGPCGSELGGVVELGAAVLFVSDRVGEQTLWRSDGSSASLVASLGDAQADFGGGEYGEPLGRVAGARVFFAATDTSGSELWATDGTAAGTGPVTNGFTAALGSAPTPLAASAQSLLFAAVDPLDDERRRLYLQRGTSPLPAGVALPYRVEPTFGALDDARGLALFVASGDSGSQLWSTDGTAAGTVQLTAFGEKRLEQKLRVDGSMEKYHDDCFARVGAPRRSGDRWYFVADVCDEGEQLWSTDGSLTGTQRSTAAPDDALSMVVAGDDAFYRAPVTADDGTIERQLFRLPLRGGAPVQLTHRAGGFPSLALRAAAPQLGLFFFAPSGSEELWMSDGTAAGTGTISVAGDEAPLARVTALAPGPGFVLAWQLWPSFSDLTVVSIAPASRVATRLVTMRLRDSLYNPLQWASSAAGVVFNGDDAEHGKEPWISDGTLAGTHPIDLVPGPVSSRARGFVASDAGVFFAARTFETGDELWLLEPGAAEPRLVADLAAGRESSSPGWLVAGPGRLLFVADDGASGREPWLVEWTAPTPTAANGAEP